MKQPEKILITGFSGSGKTTLADRLGGELNLPVVHIDDKCFNSHHRMKPTEEVVNIISDICSGNKWIVDGMYRHCAEQFINTADLLIFIDVGFFTNTKNVVLRKIKHIFSPRHKIPEGVKKRIQLNNIKRIWTNRSGYRKDWFDLINKNKKSFIFIKIRKVNKKTAPLIIKKIKALNNG